MVKRFSLTAALCTCALHGCASVQPLTREARTARYFQSIAGIPSLRVAFLRQMPKGGELHSHLSGAIYAERYLQWAAEDGMCVRRDPLRITDEGCDAQGALPMSTAIDDTALYRSLVDQFSMRNFTAAQGSGHDHFFNTFELFDARSERGGDMLAEVVARLARQNTFYIELMQSPGMGAARRLGHAAGWSDDLAAMRARLPDAGLQEAVTVARARFDAQEARMRQLLRCGATDEDPGCRVTVRYLAQAIRTVPREEVFAQVAFAVAFAQADPRVEGMNLVAPEDDLIARRDYRDHMRAIGFLTHHGTSLRVSLHAGELTPTLVPPEDASFHVHDAVVVAGARRIGHGTDIAFEDDLATLLPRMSREHIAVEVALTSAEAILGVGGHDHPFALYRRHRIPMVLCTDDEGVSRTDLSREYLRAAETYGLGYIDLKDLARNALRYSFLPGDELGEHGACEGESRGAEGVGPRCRALLDESPKASAQWRLEGLFRRFESTAWE